MQSYCIISYTSESLLHPSGVAKSSTSFGWGKGGKVTSAGWQVSDLIWHVISRSGVVISITNCYMRFTLLTYLLTDKKTLQIKIHACIQTNKIHNKVKLTIHRGERLATAS